MTDRPKRPANTLPFTRAATPPNMRIVSTRASPGSAAWKMGWFSGGTLTHAMGHRLERRAGARKPYFAAKSGTGLESRVGEPR